MVRSMLAEIRCGRGPYSEGERADVKVSTARSIDAVVALAVAAFTFAYRYLSFERFPNEHFVVLSRAQQCLVAVRWKHLAPHIRSIAVMAIAVELVMCSEMLRDPLATRVRDIVAPLVLVLASMSVVVRTLSASRSARWGARAALGALFLAVGVAVAGAGSFGESARNRHPSKVAGNYSPRPSAIRRSL